MKKVSLNIIILKILKISKYVPLAATNFSKIDPSQRVCCRAQHVNRGFLTYFLRAEILRTLNFLAHNFPPLWTPRRIICILHHGCHLEIQLPPPDSPRTSILYANRPGNGQRRTDIALVGGQISKMRIIFLFFFT